MAPDPRSVAVAAVATCVRLARPLLLALVANCACSGPEPAVPGKPVPAPSVDATRDLTTKPVDAAASGTNAACVWTVQACQIGQPLSSDAQFPPRLPGKFCPTYDDSAELLADGHVLLSTGTTKGPDCNTPSRRVTKVAPSGKVVWQVELGLPAQATQLSVNGFVPWPDGGVTVLAYADILGSPGPTPKRLGAHIDLSSDGTVTAMHTYAMPADDLYPRGDQVGSADGEAASAWSSSMPAYGKSGQQDQAGQVIVYRRKRIQSAPLGPLQVLVDSSDGVNDKSNWVQLARTPQAGAVAVWRSWAGTRGPNGVQRFTMAFLPGSGEQVVLRTSEALPAPGASVVVVTGVGYAWNGSMVTTWIAEPAGKKWQDAMKERKCFITAIRPDTGTVQTLALTEFTDVRGPVAATDGTLIVKGHIVDPAAPSSQARHGAARIDAWGRRIWVWRFNPATDFWKTESLDTGPIGERCGILYWVTEGTGGFWEGGGTLLYTRSLWDNSPCGAAGQCWGLESAACGSASPCTIPRCTASGGCSQERVGGAGCK